MLVQGEDRKQYSGRKGRRDKGLSREEIVEGLGVQAFRLGERDSRIRVTFETAKD